MKKSTTKKQLTPYLIVLIVLFSFSILLNVINIIVTLAKWNFVSKIVGIGNGFMIYSFIIALVSLTLAIIYLVKLVKVKKGLFIWTHIIFSYYIITNVFNSIYTAIKVPYGIFATPFGIIGVGGAIAVWITFYKHLQRAKRTKKLIFD